MNIGKIEKVDKVLSKITLDNTDVLKSYNDVEIINLTRQFVNKYHLNNNELYNELKERKIDLDSLGYNKYPLENDSDRQKRIMKNKLELDLEEALCFYEKSPKEFLLYNSEKTITLMLVANYYLDKTYTIPLDLKNFLLNEKKFNMEFIINFCNESYKKELAKNESLVDKIVNMLRKVFPKKRL
tara:strand:+ start:36440 stop:36991 length:552 start_codon:yes stop_codon:yes gene_type:complete